MPTEGLCVCEPGCMYQVNGKPIYRNDIRLRVLPCDLRLGLEAIDTYAWVMLDTVYRFITNSKDYELGGEGGKTI